MYKILCENYNEDNQIFLRLIKNQRQLCYKEIKQADFSINDINNFLETCDKQIEEEYLNNLEIEIFFNSKEELSRMIEIINNSNDLNFTLNVNLSEVLHKDVIKMIDEKSTNKNIKIEYQTDSEAIKYDEYRKMYNKLYSIIDEVKSLDLTPLEEVMYVFDIVKSNIYKDDKDNAKNSRDLNKVINTDYIVCVGYSNYMEFILKELGHEIKSVSFKYDDHESGHRRNSIHLKDEKYCIDNLFFLDATANSKRSLEDNEYINNYLSFLKPYILFNLRKKNEHFVDDIHYLILEYSKEEVENIIKEGLYLKNEKDKDLIVHSLRNILKIKRNIGNDILFAITEDNKEKLLEYYDEMYKFSNKGIDSTKFIECLYNVRKNQYEMGRIESIPTIDEFEQIMIKNYGKDYFVSGGAKHLLDILFNYGNEDITNRSILEDKIKSFTHSGKTYKKSI